MVCESVGKADLLSDHSDRHQSREVADPPLGCPPFSCLTIFAFRSSEVRRLLSDLGSYGGTYQLGMFPFFLRRIADVMGPRLNEVFRRLVRLGSFPPCWRQANVNPIPMSFSVANYRPISMTSPMFKVFERLVSVRFG